MNKHNVFLNESEQEEVEKLNSPQPEIEEAERDSKISDVKSSRKTQSQKKGSQTEEQSQQQTKAVNLESESMVTSKIDIQDQKNENDSKEKTGSGSKIKMDQGEQNHPKLEKLQQTLEKTEPTFQKRSFKFESKRVKILHQEETLFKIIKENSRKTSNMLERIQERDKKVNALTRKTQLKNNMLEEKKTIHQTKLEEVEREQSEQFFKVQARFKKKLKFLESIIKNLRKEKVEYQQQIDTIENKLQGKKKKIRDSESELRLWGEFELKISSFEDRKRKLERSLGKIKKRKQILLKDKESRKNQQQLSRKFLEDLKSKEKVFLDILNEKNKELFGLKEDYRNLLVKLETQSCLVRNLRDQINHNDTLLKHYTIR